MKKKLKKCNLLSIFFIFLLLFISMPTAINAQSDFLEYINGEHWDYKNVLILGVGADWQRQLEIVEKYHFDKVIPISDGNVPLDYIKAAIEKLGIPTGGLEDLRGKNIEHLYAHSWGTSRTINFISMTSNIKVGQLHCMGSPESVVFNNALKNSLDRGIIGKVFFHINEVDLIAGFRHFPKLTTGGGFTDKIEYHFYMTERKSIDTDVRKPFNVPVLNVPFGFDKYIHYNCSKKDHDLTVSYFENMSVSYNRDPQQSAFRGVSLPPFYTVPSYFITPDPKLKGKSINEAQIMTEMTHGKKRALIVGKSPEADLMYKNMTGKLGQGNVKRIYSYVDDKTLQSEARNFGADVILGIRENRTKEPSGVLIDPKPVKVGNGGSETKKKVINSKPSDNTLYWDYK